MKRWYLILVILQIISLSGCDNKEEEEKNEYITIKSQLRHEENFLSAEELPLDIEIELKRDNAEVVEYIVLFKNPNCNMKHFKAMVMHNHYNEDVYPSIGLFDEASSLMMDEEDNQIELRDVIKTTKNISKLDLEFRIWFSYEDDEGKVHNNYYKRLMY